MEKKERKQLKEQVRADLTLLEENKKLKSQNESLRISGEEMGKEIVSLRASIASYKSANTRLKANSEKVKKELQDVVNGLRKTSNELSEVNTAKDAKYKESINTINDLQGKLDEMHRLHDEMVKQNEYIKDLNKEATTKIAYVNRENKELSNKVTCLKANKDWYNNLPWYKKIFVNKI